MRSSFSFILLLHVGMVQQVRFQRCPGASNQAATHLALSLARASEPSDEQGEVHYVGLLDIECIEHHLHQNLWVG